MWRPTSWPTTSITGTFPRPSQREVEGFAEYVSALMNQYWGQAKVNESKIRNQQKEYAEAYKYFLTLGEKGGLKAVWEHMERKNKAGK